MFITAGMGGGTGTGASHVIAKVAKELGVLTIAVVTRPFSFEGRVRASNSDLGIRLLREQVDALVVIPNEKLIGMADKNTSFVEAFRMADEVLSQGVRGICDLIGTTGLINLDFSDVKTIVKDAGMCHMGVGFGTGDDKATNAVKEAIQSPLLETSIKGATGVIINIIGDENLSLFEINEAASIAREEADPDANVIFGASIDPSLQDSVKITIIATGFNMKTKDGTPVEVRTSEKQANQSVSEQQAEPAAKLEDEDDWVVPDFLKKSLGRE